MLLDGFVMQWNGRLSFLDKADLLPIVQVLRALIVANPERRVHLLIAGGERPGEKVGETLVEYSHQLGMADSVTLMGQVTLARRPLLYAAPDILDPM